MVTRSLVGRLRQPEYTGENRCLPCTVLNVVLVTAAATVAALATAVNQSDSVHEVTERLGMSRGSTRRLLRELDLVTFVTHPLGASQLAVSETEIKRRIDTASS